MNDSSLNNSRFSIGKCLNKCITEGKNRTKHSSIKQKCEMFGDNYNTGILHALPALTNSIPNSTTTSSYNTTGKYLTDSNSNFILDKNNNKILLYDYMNTLHYVPALDAPYPVLQSQIGKAAYDIRGIPNTPLSTAPISGLPGRPVI